MAQIIPFVFSTDAVALAHLAQDCVMTDHHLDLLHRVSQPDGHVHPALRADTVLPLWELAMVKQVRRSWRLALQFQAGLDAVAAGQ